MPIDLDSVLASRDPGTMREATLGGLSIKFAPLTLGILADLSSGRIEKALAAMVPDEDGRSVLAPLPISSLDAVLVAVYGAESLGK